MSEGQGSDVGIASIRDPKDEDVNETRIQEVGTEEAEEHTYFSKGRGVQQCIRVLCVPACLDHNGLY